MPAPAAVDPVWTLLRAAAAMAASLERRASDGLFAADDAGLRPTTSAAGDAVLAWRGESGWQSQLPAGDPRAELLNLYLPICSATPARPITVGHLGQSLDGFIATPSGDSQFVTGTANIVHVHRMRALCDAVVVGAGTVAADDPQLTTRHVPGPNPLRVVIDAGGRLTPAFRVFTDRAAPTVYACGRSRLGAGGAGFEAAEIEPIDEGTPEDEAAQVLRRLRDRGCARIFIEGGGVTVSTFLQANLLDRLQIAVAPVLIGEGRPAIRLTPHANLRDCLRPGYRVFRMGGDVLFDCDLKADPAAAEAHDRAGISRII